MKRRTLTLCIPITLIAAMAVYLVATTPRHGVGVRFPLSAEQRTMIADVPASAEAFALIPTAAALDAQLAANPMTRDAIEEWETRQSLPRPWMLGSADILAWRDSKQTRYYLRLDPLRATLVRAYLMVGGDLGDTLLINAPVEQPINPGELSQILTMAEKLPPGDAFVVQRQDSRGAFPPIGRPSVTSIQVTSDEILLTSRAAHDADVSQLAAAAHFPRGAMLTASFATMPRIVEDLNRLFGAKVSTLLENGGTIAIYDIDTHKLLPRPRCVIVIPADDVRRDAFAAFQRNVDRGESLGFHIRTADRGGELLLSFDDSIDLYTKDTFVSGAWPTGQWAVRSDPKRLVPVLTKLSDSIGLRIASPRLFRSARDLGRWISGLQQANSIEASDRVNGSAEELRVRISAK